MIVGKNIHKSYGKVEILKGIDLHIQRGEVVSIVGASGAGKTTLLQILGTLDNPSDGQVIINGVDTQKLSEKELARFRNQNIGFVFQFHQLLPEFTALENAIMPGLIAHRPKNEVEEQAREILDYLKLSHRLDHKPNEMSGGEKQRVAVARALINNPEVILADEPSGNLDSRNQEELHELFFSLRDRFKQTFVIVSHDAHLAEISDRILTIKDGQIISQ